jgi:hypothetical protein
MGQNVAAAPQRLVVRVGNNNSGALARAGYHLIVVGWGHGLPRETPKGKQSLSSLIQLHLDCETLLCGE